MLCATRDKRKNTSPEEQTAQECTTPFETAKQDPRVAEKSAACCLDVCRMIAICNRSLKENSTPDVIDDGRARLAKHVEHPTGLFVVWHCR